MIDYMIDENSDNKIGILDQNAQAYIECNIRRKDGHYYVHGRK